MYLCLRANCLESGVQSHCWGAQMHIQSCVLCSLNSVNPSAVPKLRTQASPVFSPLSRIFTLFSPSADANTTSTFPARPRHETILLLLLLSSLCPAEGCRRREFSCCFCRRFVNEQNRKQTDGRTWWRLHPLFLHTSRTSYGSYTDIEPIMCLISAVYASN